MALRDALRGIELECETCRDPDCELADVDEEGMCCIANGKLEEDEVVGCIDVGRRGDITSEVRDAAL
jgi:hypothetical protein